MLIIPFIHNVIDNNKYFNVHSIKILTIGGRNLWEEKNTLHLDNDILNPNDIYRKGLPIKYDKKLQLCEVDVEKTNISDFYKWDELPLNDTDTFCWRTYYYLSGTNDICWLETPENEKIDNYTIKDLIKAIIQKK